MGPLDPPLWVDILGVDILGVDISSPTRLLHSKIIRSKPTCLFTRSWKAIHLAAG